MSKNKKSIVTESGHRVNISRDFGGRSDESYYHESLPNRSYDFIESIDKALNDKKK